MTAPESAPEAQPATELDELRRLPETLRKSASILAPLARDGVFDDLARLEKQIALAREKLGELGAPVPDVVAAMVDAVDRLRNERVTEMRERLGRDLKDACTAAGLAMRVLSKEGPVRLRIPPFGVTIDRDKGTATIEFADEVLETCRAAPADILAARERALASMGSFDPAAFFDACLAAWKASVATGRGGSGGGGERVEIVEFLPYLALELQPAKFRKAPSALTYVDYGKARFAYDVMRLREARTLSREGWRLNLGVATGASASSSRKSGVVWIGDGSGEGEYKLTIFFKRTDDA